MSLLTAPVGIREVHRRTDADTEKNPKKGASLSLPLDLSLGIGHHYASGIVVGLGAYVYDPFVYPDHYRRVLVGFDADMLAGLEEEFHLRPFRL